MSANESDLDLMSLLDPRCVACQVECTDAEAALRQAAALLERVGAVSAEYADQVVAREREYATGLPTQPVGVALPHADRGIVRSAISVLTLHNPILFREMGSDDRQVLVALVIMLALPAGEKHVQAIGTLAEIIQQPGALDEMVGANTPAQLYQVLIKWTTGRRPAST